jgi:hypothetical protein
MLSPADPAQLCAFDTCPSANAIETLELRLKKEGYTWSQPGCGKLGAG